MKIMIFGTFDLLHPGHEFVLREAKKRGDVTVIVARDHHVQQIKGRSPVEAEDDRVSAIQKKFPDVSVELGDVNDYMAPIHRIKPDLILLGYDQKLPPGIKEEDLSCRIERLAAHKPGEFKSSLKRKAESRIKKQE